MKEGQGFAWVPKRFRYNFARSKEFMSIPSLIELQRQSYEEFLQKDILPHKRKKVGLQGALMSFFPVRDFSEKIHLDLDHYILEEPKCDVEEARQKGLTYTSALKVKLRLTIYEDVDGHRIVKAVREQDTYLGDVPVMTPEGTFVINGVERVVVSQVHRSPGVFFDKDKSQQVSNRAFFARIIPAQGAWLDFEFNSKDQLCVRIDRKKKILITTLLMALEGDQRDAPQDLAPWIRPGMQRIEILRSFYDTVEWTLKGAYWSVPFREEAWKNIRLSCDLTDGDTGIVVVKKGEKLTPRILRNLLQNGLKNVEVELTDVLGRYLAEDLIHPETGEVYAVAG